MVVRGGFRTQMHSTNLQINPGLESMPADFMGQAGNTQNIYRQTTTHIHIQTISREIWLRNIGFNK